MRVINGAYKAGYWHMLPEDRAIAKRIHSMEFTFPSFIIPGTTEPLRFNTFGDLHLIPSERPVIVPPSVKTMYVEVPGAADGDIDMSEALTGSMIYGNREGTVSFYYENKWRFASPNHVGNATDVNHPITVADTEYKAEHPDAPSLNRDFWTTGMLYYNDIYDLLMRYVHGKWANVKLYDEPDYYYTGRWFVDSFKSGSNMMGTVTLKYKLEPYRYITAKAAETNPGWDKKKI